jgi:hypothetical protein
MPNSNRRTFVSWIFLPFYENFQLAHELTDVRKALCKECDGTGSKHFTGYQTLNDGYEEYDYEEECQWCAYFSEIFLRPKPQIRDWLQDFKHLLEALEHV